MHHLTRLSSPPGATCAPEAHRRLAWPRAEPSSPWHLLKWLPGLARALAPFTPGQHRRLGPDPSLGPLCSGHGCPACSPAPFSPLASSCFILTAPLKSASPSVRHAVQSTCLGPMLLPFVSRLGHFPLLWPALLSFGPVSLLQNGDNKGTWSKQLNFWSSARSFTKWR